MSPHVSFMLFACLIATSSADECLNCRSNRKFYRAKDCARSTAPIASFANYRSLSRCLSYASSRNALGVNFSPPEASEFREESFKAPCQILACPEVLESNLVNDSAYDYYTFYQNLTDDSTCVKSVGMYKLIQEKSNYTQAIKTCQSFNADLAQVHTEILTNSLATLVSNSIKNWSKSVYVGMDDFPKRGMFTTSFGNRLTCYKYRAWAPGHPRLMNRKKNCVVLDAEKTWKVTGCRNQLPFLCEIYPSSPLRKKKSKDCSKITENEKRKKCEQRNKLHRKFKCNF